MYSEIFMEKHWRSVISRSVCDYFFEAQTKATSPSDIPPVIPTPHYYLITIYRNNLYFVAVLQNEGKSTEIYTCRSISIVGGSLGGGNQACFSTVELVCSPPSK